MSEIVYGQNADWPEDSPGERCHFCGYTKDDCNRGWVSSGKKTYCCYHCLEEQVRDRAGNYSKKAHRGREEAVLIG